MTRTRHHRLTDQDRAIIAKRDAGATRKAVQEHFGVTVSTVQRVEWRARADARRRELLADDPQSLQGLKLIGDLDWSAADTIRLHHYHYDASELEASGNLVCLPGAKLADMRPNERPRP